MARKKKMENVNNNNTDPNNNNNANNNTQVITINTGLTQNIYGISIRLNNNSNRNVNFIYPGNNINLIVNPRQTGHVHSK